MNKGAYELRKFFRLQQEEAPLLGIKPSMLSMLLDSRRMPSIETAVAIERRYGVPCSAWVEELEDPEDSTP